MRTALKQTISLVSSYKVINAEIFALVLDDGFVIVALGVVTTHDFVDFLGVFTSIDSFIDFVRSFARFHVDKAGVDTGNFLVRQAGESDALHRQSGVAQSVKRQARAAASDDVIYMAGVAVEIQAHEFDFYIVSIRHGIIDDFRDFDRDLQMVQIVECAVYIPQMRHRRRADELSCCLPLL